MYHVIYRYEAVNNKYMIDNEKNKESSYLVYWGAKNLDQ